MPSAWTRLRAALDPLARRVNLYTAYDIGHDEYVGAFDAEMGLADVRHSLRQNAYEPQYLSAAKRLPGTGQLHDLSYRRVPTTHPEAWSVDRYAPSDCQYHVHVFESADGGPLAFSHYEVRPFADPREHFRPTYGSTYLRGVSDLDLG